MRIASLLNPVCTGLLLTLIAGNAIAQIPKGSSCDNPVLWHEAGRYVGRTVAVSGYVTEVVHGYNVRGAPTWINIGNPYPRLPRFTMVIWGNDLSKFRSGLTRLNGKVACAVGTLSFYKGAVEMALNNPSQLEF